MRCEDSEGETKLKMMPAKYERSCCFAVANFVVAGGAYNGFCLYIDALAKQLTRDLQSQLN
jgi:hypothetical protein